MKWLFGKGCSTGVYKIFKMPVFMEKKNGELRPAKKGSRKSMFILIGALVTLFSLMILPSLIARKNKQQGLNTEVPTPDKKLMDEYDSVSGSKELSYLEKAKERKKQQERQSIDEAV